MVFFPCLLWYSIGQMNCMEMHKYKYNFCKLSHALITCRQLWSLDWQATQYISPDLQCLWFHDDSHEGCRLTQLSAEDDLNHVSSLALLCHSDNSTSGCQTRVSSAWSLSPTLCWRLFSGYLCKNLFSRHNFVENTSRFLKMQNLIFRIEYFVVTWYFGWGAQVLLEEAWPRPD